MIRNINILRRAACLLSAKDETLCQVRHSDFITDLCNITRDQRSSAPKHDCLQLLIRLAILFQGH